MGKRIGRWAVIAVLEDGRTLTGQNFPRFGGQRTDREAERADRQLAKVQDRKAEKRYQRAQDRLIRERLGVPVR